MMRQIRKGVFETNSSSTHSICIDGRTNTTSFPKTLFVDINDFGWEHSCLDSTESRASYIYTALLCYYSSFNSNWQMFVDQIENVCQENGVKVTFATPEFKPAYIGSGFYLDNGYIDHSDELKEILDAVFRNKETLTRFIFGDGSWVITRNDNERSEFDDRPAPEYEHEIFHKFN